MKDISNIYGIILSVILFTGTFAATASISNIDAKFTNKELDKIEDLIGNIDLEVTFTPTENGFMIDDGIETIEFTPKSGNEFTTEELSEILATTMFIGIGIVEALPIIAIVIAFMASR